MGISNIIDASQNYGIRGTNQQTDGGLLWIPPTMKIGSPPSNLGVTTSAWIREGIVLRNWELLSRNANNACGIGGRLANRWWICGKRVAAGTFTDATATVQNLTASAAILSTTTTNDGFIIASRVPFNWVSANVTTAESGTAPVHNIYYSGGTGATWTAFAATQALTGDTGAVFTNSANWATGEVFTVFAKPSDWVLTKGMDASSVPDGYYAINIRSTTASGTTGALATGIEIGQMQAISTIGAGALWEVEKITYPMHQCDGAVAMFLVNTVPNRVYAEASGC